MADFEWPESLVPSTVVFFLQQHTARTESLFTRQQQVLELSAPRWVCRLTFPPMEQTDAALMDATIAKLRGGANRVRLFDWRRPDGVGMWISHDDYAATVPETFFDDGTDFDDDTGFFVGGDGEPRHLGAPRGATSVAVEGFSPLPGQARAGDYIGFGDGRIYMLTDDLATDPEGRGLAHFTPPLRAAVAAGPLEHRRVSGWFRLISDDAGQNPTSVARHSSYALDFVEDL